MHRHFHVVRRAPTHVPVRPAKVVQLEARRVRRLVTSEPGGFPYLALEHCPSPRPSAVRCYATATRS